MENVMITDWNTADAAGFYAYKSAHQPLAYSIEHNLWIANSYASCKSVLNSQDTQIPQPEKPATLSKKAFLMLENLVRINNDEKHRQARVAATLLYERIQGINSNEIIGRLLIGTNQSSFDWVRVIARRLPVYAISKGLSFTDEDSNWVVDHMPELVKIMLPKKNDDDIGAINNVMDHYYDLAMAYVDGHALAGRLMEITGNISRHEAIDLLICNLLGLFIQSYDACRALLTISVTTLARLEIEQATIAPDDVFYKKLMNEVLRIDPPVHNTRRTVLRDIYLGGQVVAAGQTILVVMGAANMDRAVFDTPERFNIERSNNAANLTFGLGGHACIAKYFCIGLATATCQYLMGRFGGIRVLPQEICYEPQLNVKMAKQLMVGLLTA